MMDEGPTRADHAATHREKKRKKSDGSRAEKPEAKFQVPSNRKMEETGSARGGGTGDES